MSDLRESARLEFQAHLDQLQQPDGFTVEVRFADGPRVCAYYAGMRVLAATPIFNRNTGAIERFRYWVLFAEMGVLDPYCSSHTVHVFEVDVVAQQSHVVELRTADNSMDLVICRNDPHSLFEEQATHYKRWAATVEEAGGEPALQRVLDEQAAQWLERIRQLGALT